MYPLKHNRKTEFPKMLETKSVQWLRSTYASWFLAFISFAESAFLPIIIDPFLIALIMAKQSRWRWYIIISVASSVIGGMFAYFLGVLFFDTVGITLLSFYNLESSFASLATKVDANGFVFILLGAFTPIPYKLVALAGGLLHVNFLTFLVASLIGRMLRLGLVGLAAHYAGPRMLPMMRRHLHVIAVVTGVLLLIYIIIQVHR